MAKKELGEEKVNGATDFIIGDPLQIRPVDLPLVIKLAEGQSYKNPEQQLYANVLNAYAYKNPTKWATRKDVEIARLREIGDDVSKYYLYTGTQPGEQNISYKNKLIS